MPLVVEWHFDLTPLVSNTVQPSVWIGTGMTLPRSVPRRSSVAHCELIIYVPSSWEAKDPK